MKFMNTNHTLNKIAALKATHGRQIKGKIWINWYVNVSIQSACGHQIVWVQKLGELHASLFGGHPFYALESTRGQ